MTDQFCGYCGGCDYCLAAQEHYNRTGETTEDVAAREREEWKRRWSELPENRCRCRPDVTGEDIDINPDCPQHGG